MKFLLLSVVGFLVSCSVPNRPQNVESDISQVNFKTEEVIASLGQSNVVVCGDVTGNGSLSSLDAVDIELMGKGLKALSGELLSIGDVNFDGKLSIEDSKLVQEKVVGKRTYLQCPALFRTEEVTALLGRTNRVVCGDVTGNGLLTSLDASDIGLMGMGLKTLTPELLSIGDVNFDGKLSIEDGQLVQEMVVGKRKYLQCPARSAIYYSISGGCGDVNGNGSVTSVDASMITTVALGLAEPTADMLLKGDVDLDGRLSEKDSKLIQQYVIGLRKTLACPNYLFRPTTGL